MKGEYYSNSEYIFIEGDQVTKMFFIINGGAQFVLSEYYNTPYINLPEHNHFGLIDIYGSQTKHGFEINEWQENYFLLKRMFSIQTIKETEVLYLNIHDLNKMHAQFPSDFNSIISQNGVRFKSALK